MIPAINKRLANEDTNDNRTFDPKNLLESYSNLQKFFKSSPDIDTVLKLKKLLNNKTINISPPITLGERYFYSEELCTLIHELNDSTFGEKEKLTHLFHIQKMKNDPNILGNIVTECAPIPLDDVHDPKILKRIGSKNSEIFFNRRKGICNGVNHWFNYLYLNTLSKTN